MKNLAKLLIPIAAGTFLFSQPEKSTAQCRCGENGVFEEIDYTLEDTLNAESLMCDNGQVRGCGCCLGSPNWLFTFDLYIDYYPFGPGGPLPKIPPEPVLKNAKAINVYKGYFKELIIYGEDENNNYIIKYWLDMSYPEEKAHAINLVFKSKEEIVNRFNEAFFTRLQELIKYSKDLYGMKYLMAKELELMREMSKEPTKDCEKAFFNFPEYIEKVYGEEK